MQMCCNGVPTRISTDCKVNQFWGVKKKNKDATYFQLNSSSYSNDTKLILQADPIILVLVKLTLIYNAIQF